MPHDQSPEMKRCIEDCEDCHQICLQTFQLCLAKGGPHAEASHLRVLLDCAQICQTSADFMIRGSDLHALTCGACAEVCARCAESCERMADEAMRRCAEVCRRCTESCRLMARSVAGSMSGAAL